MALLRSLRNLARKTTFKTPNPKPFITTRTNPILTTTTRSPLNPLHAPPWKLSTPFYFRSGVVSIRHVHFLRDDKLGLNKDVKKEVVGTRGGGGVVGSWVNWPNFISVSRLVSGPVLGWMIMQDMYLPAFIGLAVSGATDWLDGYVARRMGINSVVGSYLDPLADKVLIGSVAVAMVERGLLNSGLVALVVMRDLALVGGAVYVRASHLGFKSRTWSELFNLDGIRPQKVEPLMISKVNTCLQLALVAGALLQPEFGTQETESYITYLSWLVAATTMGSTVAYGRQHLKNKSIFIQKNA